MSYSELAAGWILDGRWSLLPPSSTLANERNLADGSELVTSCTQCGQRQSPQSHTAQGAQTRMSAGDIDNGTSMVYDKFSRP